MTTRPLNDDEQILKAKVSAARRRLQQSLDKTEYLVRDLRRRRGEGVDKVYADKLNALIKSCSHRVEVLEKRTGGHAFAYVCQCCGLIRSAADE